MLKVQYLCRTIDKHGLDILRTVKNKYYPIYVKQQAKELYSKRKQTIERIFGDCKESHCLRYTEVRDLNKIRIMPKFKESGKKETLEVY